MTMLARGWPAAAVAVLVLAVAGGCVHKQPKPRPADVGVIEPVQPAPVPVPAPVPAMVTTAPTNAAPVLDRSEQIRNACLDGRRLICGRILEITKDGLVVESGYTGLDREPLNRSWIIPANVTVTLDKNAIESRIPGGYCYGTVLVTDLPKRGAPPIHKYDYILLLGYPAGEYQYVPVAPVTKTIRRFTGTIEMAVYMNLLAEQK